MLGRRLISACSKRSLEIGDYYGGGVFAGEFNGRIIIMSVESGQSVYGQGRTPVRWSSETVTTGAQDENAGFTNYSTINSQFSLSNYPAFTFCAGYGGGGFIDWYFPAINELQFVFNNLAGHPELQGNVLSGRDTISSTEFVHAPQYYCMDTKLNGDGSLVPGNTNKNTSTINVIPIRSELI